VRYEGKGKEITVSPTDKRYGRGMRKTSKQTLEFSTIITKYGHNKVEVNGTTEKLFRESFKLMYLMLGFGK